MDCVLAACTTHLPDLGRLRSESPNLSSIDENSPKHSKIFPKRYLIFYFTERKKYSQISI